MNILLLNNGDLDSTSATHVCGVAQSLGHLGYDCVVGVPNGKAGADDPNFPVRIVVISKEILAESPFRDGRGPDLIHAWTPREPVRRMLVVMHQWVRECRLIFHLEDNEKLLVERFSGVPWEALLRFPGREIAEKVPAWLCHPRRSAILLECATGITGIVPALREFIPGETPFQELRPPVDLVAFHPLAKCGDWREKLGVAAGEKLIVYTGRLNAATIGDFEVLVDAVRLLRDQGISCRIIRSGPGGDWHQIDDKDRPEVVTEVGFLDRKSLPGLLAVADVLVQPGTDDEYNRYRLPSKLPEFLAMGKPVVLPAANIGLQLRDGIDALILLQGTAGEIAQKCRMIFDDPGIGTRIGAGGRQFAEKHYDGFANAKDLSCFYQKLMGRPLNPRWAQYCDGRIQDDFEGNGLDRWQEEEHWRMLSDQLWNEQVELREAWKNEKAEWLSEKEEMLFERGVIIGHIEALQEMVAARESEIARRDDSLSRIRNTRWWRLGMTAKRILKWK